MSNFTKMPPIITPEIIFVLGPPGAGKTWLCKRAEEEFHNVQHVVMSMILHEEETELGSPQAAELYKKLPTGTLVRGSLAVAVLEKHVKKLSGYTAKTILLDGFPRNMDQAQCFEDKYGCAKAAISLTCSKEVAEERRMKRGRPEDDPKIGDTRYKGHFEETVPAIEYLKGTKCRVVEVSSDKSGVEGWSEFKNGLSKALKG